MISRHTPGIVIHGTLQIHTVIMQCDYLRSADMVTIPPADVVLLEGILVLYDVQVRDLMHMKLFVDTDSDTRLARRGKSGQECVI